MSPVGIRERADRAIVPSVTTREWRMLRVDERERTLAQVYAEMLAEGWLPHSVLPAESSEDPIAVVSFVRDIYVKGP